MARLAAFFFARFSAAAAAAALVFAGISGAQSPPQAAPLQEAPLMPASAPPLDSAFAQKASARARRLIQNSGLSRKGLGIQISLVRENRPPLSVFGLNADRLFIPASLVKIASLSAFWHYFPKGFRFQTRLKSAAGLEGGILKGDLIIEGGGDPSFVSESLWDLTRAFKRAGIVEIQGDILADGSLYKPFPPFRESNRSFHAPPSAASLNWSSHAFRIRKGAGGLEPLVISDLPLAHIQTHNLLRPGSRTKIQIQTLPSQEGTESFRLKGFFSAAKGERAFYRNVKNPPLYLAHSLRLFLQKEGIAVKGQAGLGRCEKPLCKTLAEWESRPLAWHTSNMMKFSSNFVSRMLAAHLPIAAKLSKRGDFKAGARLIQKYLQNEAGLSNFHFEEPSGLSRKNRFSPQDLERLLLLQQASFFAPEMLGSYPLPDEGTLKALLEAAARGQGGQGERGGKGGFLLRAKTGSLSYVAGLAGFARRPDGGKLVFVFIYNGKRAARASALFLKLLQASLS